MIRLWLTQHPIAFAAVIAVLMFVHGLGSFGDVRAGLLGAAFGALLTYLAWRPKGFGWRIEAAERRRIAEGRPEVRASWLLRSVAWVVGIAVTTFGLLIILS